MICFLLMIVKISDCHGRSMNEGFLEMILSNRMTFEESLLYGTGSFKSPLSGVPQVPPRRTLLKEELTLTFCTIKVCEILSPEG